MTPEIHPDEFDSDPEVAACILTPAEQDIKERIWVTENHDWLLKQQAKMIREQKRAEAGFGNYGVTSSGRGKKGGGRKQRRTRIGDVSYLDKENQNENNKNGGGGGGGDRNGQDGGAGGENDGGDEGEEHLTEEQRDKLRQQRSMKSFLGQRGYSTRLNYDIMASLFGGEMGTGPDDGGIRSKRKVDSKRSISKRELAREKEERRGRESTTDSTMTEDTRSASASGSGSGSGSASASGSGSGSVRESSEAPSESTWRRYTSTTVPESAAAAEEEEEAQAAPSTSAANVTYERGPDGTEIEVVEESGSSAHGTPAPTNVPAATGSGTVEDDDESDEDEDEEGEGEDFDEEEDEPEDEETLFRRAGLVDDEDEDEDEDDY